MIRHNHNVVIKERRITSVSLARLAQAQARFTGRERKASRVILKESDLAHLDISSTCFSDAHFIASRFSHADLTDADFSRAVLFGSNFERANLTRTNFEDANLQAVTLDQATLHETRLGKADVRTGTLILGDAAGHKSHHETAVAPEVPASAPEPDHFDIRDVPRP